MTNAFSIEMPLVKGWEELRDLLIGIGFKKVEVPLMTCEELKPLKKPTTLQFYQNYKC